MPNSIIEAIYERSLEQPLKPCLIEAKSGRRVTYGEYWRMIKGLSDHLSTGLSLRPGDRVMISGAQTISFLAASHAVGLAGGIFVPVEGHLKADKLSHLRQKVQAELIIGDEPATPFPSILTERAWDFLDTDASKTRPVFPEPTDEAEILFTTGTTGESKGVVMSFGASVAVAENVLYGLAMRPDNIELLPAPLNHSFGLRRYYGNILNGGTTVLMDRFVFVSRFFKAMEDYQVTALALVPSMAAMIFQLSGDELGRFRGQLDYVQVGTAAFADSDKERLRRLLPESRLYNFYGSSEAGCSCIVDYSRLDKPGCIGRPTRNASIIFVDDNGNQVDASPERPALIATGGTMLMNSYYDDPQATASVLKKGYIRSNDLAYADAAGDIILIGRRDEVINVGGNNISPLEIEEAAIQMAGIADCACVAIDDPLAGQAPKLFVVMAPGHNFAPAELAVFLSARLDAYKVPKDYEPVKSIPRTYNGKKQRNLLTVS